MSYLISNIHQVELVFWIFNLTDLTGKAIHSSHILKGKNYSATMQKHHIKQIGKDVFLGLRFFQDCLPQRIHDLVHFLPRVAGEENQ